MKKAAKNEKLSLNGVSFEKTIMSGEELEQFREVNWDLRRLMDEGGEEQDPFYDNEPLSSAGIVDHGTEYWDSKFGAEAEEDDPEDHLPMTDVLAPGTVVALLSMNDPEEREILRLSDLSGGTEDPLGGLFMGLTKKEIVGNDIVINNDTDVLSERLLMMIKEGAFPDNTEE